MKKVLLGTLTYALVSLVIAAPWHFVFFKDLYHSFGIYNRAEPIVPLGFLSMLVQGLVMALLYPRWCEGRSTAGKAMGFSLLMGLFLFSVSTLANAAKIEVAPMGAWLAVQAAFHFLQFAGAGLAFGFVYRA